MRLGEPTVSWPTDPAKFYIHCIFHEFFWGPYDSLESVREAMTRMTAIDNYWDYDPAAVVKGDLTPAGQRKIEELTYINRRTGEVIV
jgi:hypothetical protein